MGTAELKRRAGRAALLASAAVLAACVGSAQPSPTPGEWLEVFVTTDAAAELRFVAPDVAAPPNTPVRLVFRNASTQPHNLTFDSPIAAGTRTIVEAGGSDAIELTTPGPGRYGFGCTIHMGMSGTLDIK